VPATDSTEFLVRYPEFSAVSIPKITLELTDVESDLSEGYFGVDYVRAIHHLAAHRMASALDLESGEAEPGQAGALSAATVDGVSSTYVIPERLSREDAILFGTVYGQLYMEVRDKRAGGPVIAVS